MHWHMTQRIQNSPLSGTGTFEIMGNGRVDLNLVINVLHVCAAQAAHSGLASHDVCLPICYFVLVGAIVLSQRQDPPLHVVKCKALVSWLSL